MIFTLFKQFAPFTTGWQAVMRTITRSSNWPRTFIEHVDSYHTHACILGYSCFYLGASRCKAHFSIIRRFSSCGDISACENAVSALGGGGGGGGAEELGGWSIVEE